MIPGEGRANLSFDFEDIISELAETSTAKVSYKSFILGSNTAFKSRPSFLVECALVFRHNALQVEESTLRDDGNLFPDISARRHCRLDLDK